MSRPSTYTPEIAAAICERLAVGESVRTISKTDGMPSQATVFVWLAKYPDFQERYARAKEAGCAALAEEMFDIADDASNDWMESNNPNDPGYRVNGEHVQRSKLRVDTRKWYLSKILPKKYGDNSKVELAGSLDLRSMSEAELDAELAAVASVAGLLAPQTDLPDDGSDLV